MTSATLPRWVTDDLRRERLEARLRAAAQAIPSHSFKPSPADDSACYVCGMAQVLPIHDLRGVDDYTADMTIDSPGADSVDTLETSAEHTGMMIALFPDAEQAKRLAVDGGEDPKDLHVTLAYFPDADASVDLDKLKELLQGFAHSLPPLTGEISGVGVFSSSQADGRVTYASVDLPGLPAFRQKVVETCARAGFTVAGNHGYSPHMTLKYGDNREIDPPNEQLSFDEIVLACGNQRFAFKLGAAETAATSDDNVANDKGRKKFSTHAYSHPHFVHGSGVPDKDTPPCMLCGQPPNSDNHFQPPPPKPLDGQTAAIDGSQVIKVIAGIDAAVDQSLVLLRSCNDDTMPEYALQARALLQGIDVTIDELMAFFDIPDPDKNEADDEAPSPEQALKKPKKHKHLFIHPSRVRGAGWYGANNCVACGKAANDPDHDGDVDAPGAADADAPTTAATDISSLQHVITRPRPTEDESRIESETAFIEPKQKAFVTELNGRTLLTAPASTFVQSWEKAATPNKHLLWMQGRFVGAEKANRNNALWTTGDLEMGNPTVAYGPLNWLHEAKHVIGCIADSKFQVPNETAAAQGAQPYISALSAIWTWIYPDEAWVVENASDQGRLWYSMECVSDNVECTGAGGCGTKASYGDYMGGKGCAHMRQRSATRRFENPTFLGGAVIVPPVRPGWADAEARIMRQAASMAEKAFDQAGQPDIPANVWEQMLAQVVQYAEQD